jgi:hypothetical protein
MDYFDKALADLVFAGETLKGESSVFSGETLASFQRILDDLDEIIATLEEFLRDKDRYL